MSDAMGRISDILNDEESLRQLSELAEMICSGNEPDDEGCKDTGKTGQMPDIELMMKLTGLAGAMSSTDKNTELLMALRPHLSPGAQQRLDRAVRLLKLIMVYEAAKDSGLLENLI